MIRRPPRSTLFPTRRSSDLECVCVSVCVSVCSCVCVCKRERSEEHTSELLSHLNLVCRLLLEKKQMCSSTYRTKRVASSLLRPHTQADSVTTARVLCAVKQTQRRSRGRREDLFFFF